MLILIAEQLNVKLCVRMDIMEIQIQVGAINVVEIMVIRQRQQLLMNHLKREVTVALIHVMELKVKIVSSHAQGNQITLQLPITSYLKSYLEDQHAQQNVQTAILLLDFKIFKFPYVIQKLKIVSVLNAVVIVAHVLDTIKMIA